MGNTDVMIRLRAEGASQVKTDLQGIAQGATKLDNELSKTGNNKALQAVTNDASKVRSGLTTAGDSAGKLGADLNKVGSKTLQTVATDAGKVSSGLDNAAASSGKLGLSLESLRNASAGMAVLGASGLALANHLSGAFVEADRLSGQLTTLLEGRGLGGSVDQVKQLANEIAGLKGLDDDAVASAIGQAIATGRTRGLVEYGIVIDKAGQSAIAAAGKISAQAQSQEVLNQVMRASGAAVDVLRASTSASTQAIGEMGVRFGNIEEGIGEGAANVQAALYKGILSPIFDILEATPELQTTVGGVLTIGSAALTTGGSLATVVYQVGLMTTGMNAMGITSVASFGKAAAASGPLLVRALAIGAAILAAVGAFYLLDKLLHQKEDAALQANIAIGDALDPQIYENAQKQREKRGLSRQSMEEFKAGAEAGQAIAPDADRDPAEEFADLKKTFANLQSGQMPPSLQMPVTLPALPVAAPVTPSVVSPMAPMYMPAALPLAPALQTRAALSASMALPPEGALQTILGMMSSARQSDGSSAERIRKAIKMGAGINPKNNEVFAPEDADIRREDWAALEAAVRKRGDDGGRASRVQAALEGGAGMTPDGNAFVAEDADFRRDDFPELERQLQLRQGVNRTAPSGGMMAAIGMRADLNRDDGQLSLAQQIGLLHQGVGLNGLSNLGRESQSSTRNGGASTPRVIDIPLKTTHFTSESSTGPTGETIIRVHGAIEGEIVFKEKFAQAMGGF